jgi:hypothetical protein
MRQLRLFPATLLTGILATLVVGAAVAGNIDVFPLAVKGIERIAPGELDEIALTMLLVGVGIAVDLANQRTRHRAEIEASRRRVFRATIRTVEDIVNNFLTQLELVRFNAQGQLPAQTDALLDALIHNAAAKLKALSDIDRIIETPMATGPGIEYPEPACFGDLGLVTKPQGGQLSG